MNILSGLAHAQAEQGDDRIALFEEICAVMRASGIYNGEMTEALLAPYLTGKAELQPLLMQLEGALQRVAV